MSFFDAMAVDDITLNGLEKWTSHLYEQLGWMTLANETGGEDKVSSYIISMKKLKNSIESRLKIITSEDAKLDLENLLLNVKHLMKITSKIFNKEHIRKTICNKCALPVKQDKTDETDITISESEIKNTLKQSGGAKSRTAQKSSKKSSKKLSKTLKSRISKSAHLNELVKLAKKTSKKSSKKPFKKSSKKTSKKQSKKTSKKQSKKTSKKQSKKQSKKMSKILVKKLSKVQSKKLEKKLSDKISRAEPKKSSKKTSKINLKKIKDEPLIKKLPKKSSKKSSKKSPSDIYKKVSKK